jgi:hypothetical protein
MQNKGYHASILIADTTQLMSKSLKKSEIELIMEMISNDSHNQERLFALYELFNAKYHKDNIEKKIKEMNKVIRYPEYLISPRLITDKSHIQNHN